MGTIKYRLGIVGSRTYTDYAEFSQFVRQCLHNRRKGVVFVSGSAKGADSLAERFAKEHDIPIEVYPADWDQHGRAAGFIRNKIIVQNSDAILAFWDGQSRGTLNTIETAEAQGKPATVIIIGAKTYG